MSWIFHRKPNKTFCFVGESVKFRQHSGKASWASLYGETKCQHIWIVEDKFCLNNKVEEVSYKIVHQIHTS